MNMRKSCSVVTRSRIGCTDPDAPSSARLQISQTALQPLHVFHNLQALLMEQPPGLRQDHLLFAALQQLNAQLSLKLLDLHCYRRLGVAKLFGCTVKASCSYNGLKGF